MLKTNLRNVGRECGWEGDENDSGLCQVAFYCYSFG